MTRALLFGVIAFGVAGQAPRPSGPDTPIFRTTTNLVVVDVFVRDRSGKGIPNLKKEDFVVLEDGKPQQITIFDFQRLDGVAPPPAPAEPARTTPTPQQMITSASPGKVQYRDRRLIVLFFDMSAMPPADQIRAQKAALKFIGEQMTPADMVAVMSFATALKVELDFTGDRDRLIEAIKAFNGEGAELAADAVAEDDPNAEDTGAAFTADESEFNIFNTDRKL
ncbi:MAG: VWA domain-containing protein, partial [Bryobacteraceae bacterium]